MISQRSSVPPLKILLVFVIAVVALCMPCSAALVVSWGTSAGIVDVAPTQNMTVGRGQTFVNLSGSYTSPAQGAEYYSNYIADGATPAFYGASIVLNLTSGTTLAPTWQVGNDNGTTVLNDSLLTSINVGSGTAARVSSIYLWTQNEFTSEASTGAVTLNGMNSLSSDNGSSTFTNTRYVVRLGLSSFYVSGTFGEGAQSFSDPTLVSWFNYDPSTDFTNFSGASAALTGVDFQNLTAAGIVLTATSASGSNQSRIFQFRVNATVVPEPATVALLVSGSLLLVFSRQIRSRERK